MTNLEARIEESDAVVAKLREELIRAVTEAADAQARVERVLRDLQNAESRSRTLTQMMDA